MLHKRQVTELLPAFTVSPSILRALWHYGVLTGMLAFPALERLVTVRWKCHLCGTASKGLWLPEQKVIPCYSQASWHSLPDQPGNVTALQEILAGNRHSC